ncbi:MAG: AAA family ATPase [Anaerolineaceae bacterium]
MKLQSVRVQEFQSIQDSNEFEIGDITCLVGKNEAGKTAILQALYRLNPIIEVEGNFDVTEDYPRAFVEDYQQDIVTRKRKPATVVTALFRLDPEEVTEIESEFGPGVLVKPEFTYSKGYENTRFYSLSINEDIGIRSLIGKAELPARLLTSLAKSTGLDELREMLQSKNSPENADHLKRLNDELNKIGERSLCQHIFEKYISKHIPKFMYFDEYYQMTGRENLDALIKRNNENILQKSDYPLLGLLELARISLKEVLNPTRTQELVNKLEGASNHLSRKILKYWSQNKHIELRFDVQPARSQDPEGMTSGTNIWARVYDSKHKVSTLLGSRSRGFVWFFSFLAWFYKQQKVNEPLILLLDEPGLFLHGKAQEDLLHYIEVELKNKHQVIYTTHSPFMVDARKFERVRIVQDKEMDTTEDLPDNEHGTKVLNDILEATDDSLFPLQGALGYEIYQTLFVGPNNLVVEGVSDLLVLQTISTLFDRRGKTSLSPKWTITPVGGTDKVPTFVAILRSQKGMTTATLIDIQAKDRQLIENLFKKKLLKKQNVNTYADFLGREEADLEDMFGDEFYLRLVNKEYEDNLQNPITVDDIKNGHPRLLVRLSEYFDGNQMKGDVTFNHYRPARYFVDHIGELEKDIPESAIENFEKVFETLNKLLN